jgi:subtilisin family serine protease
MNDDFMDKIFKTAVIACAVTMILTAQAAEPTDTASQQLFEIKNTCIVRFDDGISKFDVKGRARGMVAAANAQAKHIYKHSIKGFAVNMNCGKAKAAFAGQNDIVSFEPDSLMVLYPGPPSGKGKKDSTTSESQVIPWGIGRVGYLPADPPIDNTGLTAWILDTGIDLDHPDLNVDTDPTRAFSAFTSRKDSSYDDGHGHGTHVAGTIAAIDNEIDVVGVAAGATVVPVKVLNSRGSGSTSGVIAGIDHVAANASPGDCANLSLGGAYSQNLNDAVELASLTGTYFALAAGNESQNAMNTSPASAGENGYDNIWTISAIDAADDFASFSNFGNPPIEFAAPGVGILSLKKDGGTTVKSGTSMAAPHACAVLMLTMGEPSSDGTANGETDGNPDPIIHL